MGASQAKGARWAASVRDWLGNWFHGVEKRALEGALDRGDIAGLPNAIIEAKCPAPKYLMATMSVAILEASQEQANAGASVGFAVIKRPGKTSPGSAYWLVTPESVPTILAWAAAHAGRSLDRVVYCDGCEQRSDLCRCAAFGHATAARAGAQPDGT